jgi:flagellar motor switch protein FliN/FliY
MTQQIEAPPQFAEPIESHAHSIATDDPAVHLADVPMNIEVLLGKLTMSLRSISELQPGSVLVLDRAAGENVDMYVNGVQLASVEIVPLEHTPGLRVADFIFEERAAAPKP